MFQNETAFWAFWGGAAGALIAILILDIIRRLSLSVVQLALVHGEIKALEKREREQMRQERASHFEEPPATRRGFRSTRRWRRTRRSTR